MDNMQTIAERKQYRGNNYVDMEVDIANNLLTLIASYDTNRLAHNKQDDVNLSLIKHIQEEIKYMIF